MNPHTQDLVNVLRAASNSGCLDCSGSRIGMTVADDAADTLERLEREIAELRELAREAEETLRLGRAFAGKSAEEFGNWCGHADLVERELRSALGIRLQGEKSPPPKRST